MDYIIIQSQNVVNQPSKYSLIKSAQNEYLSHENLTLLSKCLLIIYQCHWFSIPVSSRHWNRKPNYETFIPMSDMKVNNKY